MPGGRAEGADRARAIGARDDVQANELALTLEDEALFHGVAGGGRGALLGHELQLDGVAHRSVVRRRRAREQARVLGCRGELHGELEVPEVLGAELGFAEREHPFGDGFGARDLGFARLALIPELAGVVVRWATTGEKVRVDARRAGFARFTKPVPLDRAHGARDIGDRRYLPEATVTAPALVARFLAKRAHELGRRDDRGRIAHQKVREAVATDLEEPYPVLAQEERLFPRTVFPAVVAVRALVAPLGVQVDGFAGRATDDVAGGRVLDLGRELVARHARHGPDAEPGTHERALVRDERREARDLLDRRAGRAGELVQALLHLGQGFLGNEQREGHGECYAEAREDLPNRNGLGFVGDARVERVIYSCSCPGSHSPRTRPPAVSLGRQRGDTSRGRARMSRAARDPKTRPTPPPAQGTARVTARGAERRRPESGTDTGGMGPLRAPDLRARPRGECAFPPSRFHGGHPRSPSSSRSCTPSHARFLPC